jgi:hypothetical protein
MTTDVTTIDPAGRQLPEIIRDLVSHPAARCRLPRGLYLTWRSADGTHGRFQALRKHGVKPSEDEIETVKRDAGRAGVTLGGTPEVIDLTYKGIKWMGYSWAVTIGGTQDKLPLFTMQDVHIDWR